MNKKTKEELIMKATEVDILKEEIANLEALVLAVTTAAVHSTCHQL